MLNKIKKHLLKNTFIIVNENKTRLVFEKDNFKVFIYTRKHITIDLTLISDNKSFTVATRYFIETYDDYLYLLTKTTRSPLFDKSIL